jgi:deazaflavin-dependent oxidoreductase (nitroreductase family)
MLRWVVRGLGAVVVVATGWLGFVFVAMRTGSPAMLGVVRRFNRDVVNKAMRRAAGRPGAPASLIRHEGRASGRTYETPVGSFATDDGFVISLPYGARTDWVANVLAKGSAVLVSEGHTYTVDRPAVLSTAEKRGDFPAGEQRIHQLFGVEYCLSVRRVDG